MEFASDLFSVKLISVLSLDWQENQVYVPPRPYNALSFRIKGNAVFTDSFQTVATKDNDILFMPAGVGYHLSSGAEQLLVIHFEIDGKKQNYFEVFHPASPEAFLELPALAAEEVRLQSALQLHPSPASGNAAYSEQHAARQRQLRKTETGFTLYAGTFQ